MLFPNFFKRKREFTPVPTDYPPEGSVHFLKFDTPDSFVPKGFWQYQFSSNWGEDDPNVAFLGEQIIQQCCANQRVLIVLTSNAPPTYQKGNTFWGESYTAYLQSAAPGASIFQKSERNIVCLTTGCPEALHPIYRKDHPAGGCQFDFYTFPSDTVVADAEHGLQLVEKARYGLWFMPSNGPLELEVIVNPDGADMRTIQGAVEEVCRKNGTLFMNPKI